MYELKEPLLIGVKNRVSFGKLLVHWCRREKHQLPSTISAVKRELIDWNIDATLFDAAFDNESTVTIIQTNLNEWVIPLPPLEYIEDTLEDIRATGNYPVNKLPAYYTAYPRNGRVYGEEFFYVRLADFTVTQCG